MNNRVEPRGNFCRTSRTLMVPVTGIGIGIIVVAKVIGIIKVEIGIRGFKRFHFRHHRPG